ncbi:MAG: Matrixin [Chloroflexota bacterium]|jgi:hypothetical protein|nr:Matrixin [Chloroflexota bacterium]
MEGHVRRFSRRLGACLLAVVAVVSSGSPAAAHLSVPGGDPWYWDTNNDGGPDPVVHFNPAGLNWGGALGTALKDRYSAASGTWVGGTDWNPVADRDVRAAGCFADAACHGVYFDGTDPSSKLVPGIAAYNRISWTRKKDPGDNTWYRDISDSDITFNVFDYDWWVGAGAPAANTADFQGILTHEMGHSIYLIDLTVCDPAPNKETMCGKLTSTQETFEARTLTADDKASANQVY